MFNGFEVDIVFCSSGYRYSSFVESFPKKCSVAYIVAYFCRKCSVACNIYCKFLLEYRKKLSAFRRRALSAVVFSVQVVYCMLFGKVVIVHSLISVWQVCM